MRDKPNKDLDLTDPINAYNPWIAEKSKKLHNVVDKIISDALGIYYLEEVYTSLAVEIAISRMATEIASFGTQDVCFVMILKGGAWLGFKLLEQLYDAGHDIPYGFIGLQSYGEDTKSSGNVIVTSKLDFLENFVEGRKVWIIDDVVEKGVTLCVAGEQLQQLHPKEIHLATLIDKKSERLWFPEVVGLKYEEDDFLVGAGMGYGEKYRNLSNVCKLKEGVADVGT